MLRLSRLKEIRKENKERIKWFFTSFFYHNSSLLWFYFIDQLFLIGIGRPFLKFLFTKALEKGEVNYLSFETLGKMFTSISSISLFLLFLLFFFLHIGWLFLAFSLSLKEHKNKKRITLPFLYKKSFSLLFSKTFLLIYFYCILFYPFLVVLSPLPISFPQFILNSIFQSPWLTILFLLLSLGYFLLFLYSSISLYSVIELKIKRKPSFSSFIRFSLFYVCSSISLFFVHFILYYLFIFLLSFISKMGWMKMTTFYLLLHLWDGMDQFMYPCYIVAGAMFIFITILQSDFPLPTQKFHLSSFFHLFILLGAIMLTVIVFDQEIYQDHQSNVLLISHRAGGMFAPENTLSGIKKGIQMKSDLLEIDVRFTKDHVLVLSHDQNLLRCAKVNQNINELPFNIVRTFDFGGYYAKEYQNEKIPTLEEVILATKQQVNLLIELKTTDESGLMEKKVVELLQRYQLTDKTIIASLKLENLKQIKKQDPKIKTCYLVTFIFGNIESLFPFVDIFAIEESNLSHQVISLLKNNQKKVFVWTVNQKKAMDRVLAYPIDGMITDNMYLARYRQNSLKKGMIIDFFFSLFYD